jgi:hypothetical protein
MVNMRAYAASHAAAAEEGDNEDDDDYEEACGDACSGNGGGPARAARATGAHAPPPAVTSPRPPSVVSPSLQFSDVNALLAACGQQQYAANLAGIDIPQLRLMKSVDNFTSLGVPAHAAFAIYRMLKRAGEAVV